MSKLIIILTILIGSIGLVFNLNSTDLCYSTKDLVCKRSFSYKCSKDLCSLNKKTCDEYNRKKRSFIFRSFLPLIQFQKEIKQCNETTDQIDLNKYCLNRHDCLVTNKLVVYGITLKNEIKQVDCICHGSFKFQCNRNYCTNDFDSCEMIQKLDKIPVKDCANRKIQTVIKRKGRRKYIIN